MRANWPQSIAGSQSRSYSSGSLSVTSSTAGSCMKNKLELKSLPEGPSIPHRRCPRSTRQWGAGWGPVLSLRPPCKIYGTSLPIHALRVIRDRSKRYQRIKLHWTSALLFASLNSLSWFSESAVTMKSQCSLLGVTAHSGDQLIGGSSTVWPAAIGGVDSRTGVGGPMNSILVMDAGASVFPRLPMVTSS